METFRNTRSLVALASVGLLSGCEAASNAAHGAGAYLDKTAQTIEQRTDDAAITIAVKGDLLKASSQLAKQVTVGCLNGRVSLSGTVTTPDDKARAEQIAKAVKGVQSVLNAIDVAPTPPPAP